MVAMKTGGIVVAVAFGALSLLLATVAFRKRLHQEQVRGQRARACAHAHAYVHAAYGGGHTHSPTHPIVPPSLPDRQARELESAAYYAEFYRPMLSPEALAMMGVPLTAEEQGTLGTSYDADGLGSVKLTPSRTARRGEQ